MTPPAHLSTRARDFLEAAPAQSLRWPECDDKDHWRRLITARDAASAKLREPVLAKLDALVEPASLGSCPVYRAVPGSTRLINRNQVLLDFHGGALVFGGGEINVRFEAATMALRTGRIAFAIDYSRPPDHPYPAAVEEGLAAYRHLIEKAGAANIVIVGTSAGGNIAAATLMQARDAGLSMPAGLILLTPEIDLDESGDSFVTLAGLDPVLPQSLRAPSLAYAGTLPLSDQKVSPLFGQLDKFPPVMLQSGTRDLFLSNAVRMHRKLRQAGIQAELHLWDAMPHGGFGGLSEEDREVSEEMRLFLDRLLLVPN